MELSDCARSLALELLKGHYGQVSTKLLLIQVKNFDFRRFDTWFPVSGLHCASFFEIVKVVAILIEVRSYDINRVDFSGCTPLSWVACNGQEEAVKFLLGWGEVNLDKLNNIGRTPLSYAALFGHEGVVTLLLGREDINPEKPDNFGQTPLSYAAEQRHTRVVALLQFRKVVTPTGGTFYGYDAPPHSNDHRPFPFAACYPRRLPLGITLCSLGKSHQIGMHMPSHPPEHPQRFSDTVE